MQAIAQGQQVPAELIRPMHDSRPDADDAATLQARLADDGYLMFSGFFSRADIDAARDEIFGALAGVGEIAGPPRAGIYSGTSRRRERAPDAGRYWRQVSESWALRRLSHGPQLHQQMSRLFGEPSLVQDYLFLRPVNPGKFTHLHCDAPFFTRTTDRVLTAWLALGDVPLALGPLFVVAGSHRDPAVIARYTGFDVVRDTDRKAALDTTPRDYAIAQRTTLLTRDFAAGDIVIFGMHTLHGTFDNVAADNRCRLSCDVRYQPLAEPRDPRYFGPAPGGTTGAGYGELVGAKPLDEGWHVR
ncbi:MAG: phytanoyl-CoA dioxygenase family protein [Burkholderiaceae bacterium]